MVPTSSALLKVVSCLFVLGAIAAGPVVAADPEVCFYLGSDGKPVQVSSLRAVPERFKEHAQCFAVPKDHYLADPSDIRLKGNIRQEYMGSALGRISLRWPRSAEVLFGRTPQRAVSDAATTVGRVLRTPGFPLELQRLALEWQIVFMDEALPEAQIPAYLVNNCHPAWMTPPANLYIVAQRVVAGCSGDRSRGPTQVADSELSQVLIHEIGHALEFALLKGQGQQDRMRAEGFASWFEQYASDFSAVTRKGAARARFAELARDAFAANPERFEFQGSASDYARASMYFHAIVSKRGVRGLMSVYERMVRERLPFFAAIKAETGWDASTLNEKGRLEAQR